MMAGGGLRSLAAEQSAAMLRKAKEPDPAGGGHDQNRVALAEAAPEPSAAEAAITAAPAPPTSGTVPRTGRSRLAERPRAARDVSVTGSPWGQVETAYLYAKRTPTDWDNYTAMLPEELWYRLKQTATFHSRRTRKTGNPVRLGFNHLLEAAFDTLPRTKDGEYIDAEAAAALGRQWVAGHQGYGDRQSSGSRLSKRQKTQMEDLGDVLKGFRDKVALWQVQTAVIETFLDALDGEHPRD